MADRRFVYGSPSLFSPNPISVVEVDASKAHALSRRLSAWLRCALGFDARTDVRQLLGSTWITADLPPSTAWDSIVSSLVAGKEPDPRNRHVLRQQVDEWRGLEHVLRAANQRGIAAHLDHFGDVANIDFYRDAEVRSWMGGVWDLDSARTGYITSSKHLTRDFLARNGHVIAPGELLQGPEDFSIGFPCVLKVPSSSNSMGVVAELRDQATFDRAFAFLRSKYPLGPLIAERMLSGRYFRILAIDGKIGRISEGSPVTHRGDGVRTIETIWKHAGGRPEDPSMVQRLDAVLISQNLTRGQVVELGATFQTSTTTANWVSVNEGFHPETLSMIETIGSLLSPSVLGFDVMLRDPARPMVEGLDGIIEINGAPGTWFHDDQVELGRRLMRRAFPGRRRRRPFVAIMGSGSMAPEPGVDKIRLTLEGVLAKGFPVRPFDLAFASADTEIELVKAISSLLPSPERLLKAREKQLATENVTDTSMTKPDAERSSPFESQTLRTERPRNSR